MFTIATIESQDTMEARLQSPLQSPSLQKAQTTLHHLLTGFEKEHIYTITGSALACYLFRDGRFFVTIMAKTVFWAQRQNLCGFNLGQNTPLDILRLD